MFSYRHAFHAGNHADVLKHTTLLAIAQYLVQKDTALSVIDTHAGAGLYRLDGDFASTSGEAQHGIVPIMAADPAKLAPALQSYVRSCVTIPDRPLCWPGCCVRKTACACLS